MKPMFATFLLILTAQSASAFGSVPILTFPEPPAPPPVTQDCTGIVERDGCS